MPAKLKVRVGKCYTINGIPFALITTKGRDLAYLAVGTESDGLIDGPEEVLGAATLWRPDLEVIARSRFDKFADSDKDKSNNQCPPHKASG